LEPLDNPSPDDIAPEDIAAAFEAVFRDIEKTRMADVPILNSALEVACVGFQRVGDMVVGILVTPWFINIVAAGDDAVTTRGAAVLQTVEHVFPSGTYPFLVCEEEALGRFAMCSLFSPVLEIEDQTTALAIAEASLAEVFGEAGEISEDEAGFLAVWGGEPEAPPTPEAPLEDNKANAEPRTGDMPEPRRRALLTGRLTDRAAERAQ